MAAHLMYMVMSIKKLTYLLLLVPFLSFGQGRLNVSVYPATPESSSASTTYSDDFDSYTATQNLGTQSDWTKQSTGEIKINDSGSGDNVINPAESSDYVSAYYDDAGSFTDQSSELTLDAIADWNRIGPAIRMSSSTESYYAWLGNGSGGGNKSQLIRVNSGTVTTLAEGDAWVAGHTYKLAVVGDELQCYDNGTLDTSIDTDGKYDDSGSGSKISSGYIGVAGDGNDTGCDGNDWEGKEL